MTPDAGDVLLKYVYKGLETPSDRTAALFKWQAKLAEKFGVGSIVRVLSDRCVSAMTTKRTRRRRDGGPISSMNLKPRLQTRRVVIPGLVAAVPRVQ